MSELTQIPNQLNVYYLPDSETSKQTLAILGESRVPVHTVNLLLDPLTPTQLEEILDGLGMHPEALVCKESQEYKELFPEVDLDTEDWLTLISKHPEIIRQPIAQRGRKVMLVKVPTDILKMLEVQMN
ncbi:MAG: hypothetical protein H6570_11660 [Lewinellaceae bacterium]|nr:hypothetical protein [Lewinellaceae bacterium]